MKKKMTMRKLRLQQRWVSLRSLFCTRESLIVWSTLVVPLVLVIFVPIESVLALISFVLFLVTITLLDMKKDRDNWKRSCEICKESLDEEKKKT